MARELTADELLTAALVGFVLYRAAASAAAAAAIARVLRGAPRT